MWYVKYAAKKGKKNIAAHNVSNEKRKKKLNGAADKYIFL